MAAPRWRSPCLQSELSFRGIFAWLIFTSVTISLAVMFNRLFCFRAISFSLILSVTFVASLYVWRTTDSRNNESVIKRRFISVTLASILNPLILILDRRMRVDESSIWQTVGLRLDSSIQAVVLPLFLTMILFAGPLLVLLLEGVYVLYTDIRYWKSSLQNFIWLRNNIMAPLTEEVTFRACMIPILIPCLGIKWTILASPLFFGIAHFHHMLDKMFHGMSFRVAFPISSFQFLYTTIFGIYSAFLFVRTGNFLAPFVVHSFCNHMGFPNFSELLAYKQPLRTIIALVYVLGVVLWYYLLFPLTNPDLYYNAQWQKFYYS